EGDDEEGSAITLAGLRAVARSKHLTSLTHLRLRLTGFGDRGIREIIDSGLLGRLKMLDLSYGRVTDDGAEMLAEQAETANLELLDLSSNNLTDAGVEALQATGVNLRAESQYPASGAWYEYMHGDIE